MDSPDEELKEKIADAIVNDFKTCVNDNITLYYYGWMFPYLWSPPYDTMTSKIRDLPIIKENSHFAQDNCFEIAMLVLERLPSYKLPLRVEIRMEYSGLPISAGIFIYSYK